MKLTHFNLLVVTFVLSISTYECAKILLFFPMPIWSHYMQYEAVWIKLAERGHEITLFSTLAPKTNVTNIKQIPIKLEKFEANMKKFNPATLPLRAGSNEVIGVIFLWKFGLLALEEAYESKEFKELMESKEKYDLVITESYFAMESTVALGHRFNAPVVVDCSYGATTNNLEFAGNLNLPSFMPDFRTSYTDRMSFYERFRSFYILMGTRLLEKLYYYPQQQALIDKYFGPNYPSLETMLRNVSLTLLYTNKAVSTPFPMTPNLVTVGGIHLKKPGKLPAHLQKIADAAKSGFIYVSFGSVVNPVLLPEEIQLALLNALKNIKIQVLWKIELNENDPLINSKTLPKNVLAQKWFPQTDLLGHPNLRMFITHGGISSTMEASSIGVPIIGVPLFGDQYYNLALIRQRGYCLIQEIKDLTAESLFEKMNTILHDKTFKENALKWSRISNDDLVSPVNTATYWIEYVIRHKGAHHLSPMSKFMPWYQIYSIDVVAFILLVLTLVMFVSYKLICLICFRRKSKSVNSSKKKNE